MLNGALAMQPVGSVTHTLDFDAGQGDGTLQVAALKTSMVKELANDVTLSGAIEPTAYVSEISQAMARRPCSHSQTSRFASVNHSSQ